jgi:alanyl-tRNA synthetase
MTSNEIRKSFLNFFKSKNHHIVQSAPVIPHEDPTLLFTNAGMNQFKDIFLGTRKPEFRRVADTQKCIRVSGKHNDLEQVGRDTYHHTFFEMLGNWSFADYFKAEAIEWAWELLTEIWKLPSGKLYATVFSGDENDNVEADEQAAELWRTRTGIDHSHILYFGKADNFWEMGDTGPCGPCSEIHIDLGPEFENFNDVRKSGVNTGSSRYIELWNLVFIQYNRDEAGRLHPLPSKHVDTGAGFERLVAVMQNKGSNYETDLFRPLMNEISEITGQSYQTGEIGVAFQVLADHIRSLSFAIADGAIPGNEGRGYVLRRLLRRAARFGRVLHMREPFFYKLVTPLAEKMGAAFPELVERKEYIQRVIKAEEENFNRTIDRGIEILEEKSEKLLAKGEKVFPGTDAFLLHDTYGFPLDLTQLMVEEKGLSLDIDTFNKEMDKQRDRSSQAKNSQYATLEISADAKSSRFLGYENDSLETTVVHVDKEQLVLQETPFYAESGGQIGDSGKIMNNDFVFIVLNTKKVGEYIVHIGRLIKGILPSIGDVVTAEINVNRRRATERNHTVTHLLHRALKHLLGEHVNQAGSLVHPDYMRFDFTHFEQVGPEQLTEIENIVNEKILDDLKVHWNILPFEQAKKTGAIALFGEKYEEKVRVVEVETFSRELCGGTHVGSTGKIGEFIINNESSVAAGIRRIEAFTGFKSIEYRRNKEKIVKTASQLLGCTGEEINTRIQMILDKQKDLEQEFKKLREKSSKQEIQDLLSSRYTLDGISVVAARITVKDMNELKRSGDILRDALGSGVGVLGAEINDKANFVCVITRDVIQNTTLKAGQIIKQVAKIAGGGGGGSSHMATAGAKDAHKIEEALTNVKNIIKNELDKSH